MAAHAYLKNEFTDDKKWQNLMRWLIYKYYYSINLFKHITSDLFSRYSQGRNFRENKSPRNLARPKEKGKGKSHRRIPSPINENR